MQPICDPPDPFETLLPRLRSRARRLCDTPSDAEDLCQEAALKLLQMLDRGRDIDDLDRYAMTVLRNLARQKWRARQVIEELEEDSAAVPPDAPARMACHELAQAVARLPEVQSELIRLVAAGEISPSVLAQMTGVPEGTVMSRLARARAKLRAEMGIGRNAPVTELY